VNIARILKKIENPLLAFGVKANPPYGRNRILFWTLPLPDCGKYLSLTSRIVWQLCAHSPLLSAAKAARAIWHAA